MKQGEIVVYKTAQDAGLQLEVKIEDDTNEEKTLRDFECLNYYNLHGSVYWRRTTNITNLNKAFCVYPNKEQANYTNQENETTSRDESFFASNIVTGYNKLQRTNVQPLNAFAYAFQRDCIEADTLVVVGYSFADKHINRIIRNGVIAKGNKQKRVIITKASSEADDYFKSRNQGHLVIKEIFGKHGLSSEQIEETSKSFMLNDFNCSVFTDGFGEYLLDGKAAC